MVERKAIPGAARAVPEPGHDPQRPPAHWPLLADAVDVVHLFVVAAFFLFYGLIPIFGGDGLGLVGADEPRYAQVAREMLGRHDYITPFLWGHPWLEKPALYYWRAIIAFHEFGVHDWTARLPSATFAFILITMIYIHIRRFRPGGQMDAALITATCVGILGFARGASTDMQLAAPFVIGLLGWYAWYETDSKFWLFDLYFFGGAATLAKGPVAPFMILAILFTFAALRREWSLLRRTIWIPGVILYLAMVLPWYVEVQLRNPDFLRIFFLQHNLERFATDRYMHEHGFWYYGPIMLLALMPWTVIAIRALWDAVRQSMAEWRARRVKGHYVGHTRWGDAFPEFLLLSALFPVVLFSISQSKLPGYILPAVPPLTILTGDYLHRVREKGIPSWLLILHAALTGFMVSLVLVLPWHIGHPGITPPANLLVAASLSGVAAIVLILVVVARFGVMRLRIATIAPLVVLLFFIFGVGPFLGLPAIASTKKNIRLLDSVYSARPLASILSRIVKPGEQVAVFRVRRDMEYGLSFYRDRRVDNYDTDGIPSVSHILVTRQAEIPNLKPLLAGRSYQPLFAYPMQDLVVYRVAAKE